MNGVFTNTKKSIDFFLNCFSFLTAEQDPIRRYVEVEYRPKDREWAYAQVKADVSRKKLQRA